VIVHTQVNLDGRTIADVVGQHYTSMRRLQGLA